MEYSKYVAENNIVSHVTFIYLLGMGGLALDNAMSGGRGAVALRQKVNALHGTYCPQLYRYTDQDVVAKIIKDCNPHEKIMLVGDSCGANRLSWVAHAVYPRVIDYYFAIQASDWCNLNCPPIPDNVKEVVNVYGGLMTVGLGQFKPPLVFPPLLMEGEKLYDGKTRVGNNGKTKVTYHFVRAAHPDDWDVVNVHNPIVAKAKELIAGG